MWTKISPPARPQFQPPKLIPGVLSRGAVGNYLGHGKPGIGFEFGNRFLKFLLKFVLFPAQVVSRFWHEPNGTPSGPGIRFTIL